MREPGRLTWLESHGCYWWGRLRIKCERKLGWILEGSLRIFRLSCLCSDADTLVLLPIVRVEFL